MFQDYILIKGAGDLASGVACVLGQSGYRVIMTEMDQPTCVRRAVSFAEAVYEGRALVEGLSGVLAGGFEEAWDALSSGNVAVIVDPDGEIVKKHPPLVYIDASMAKENRGTSMGDARVVISLGPGYTAGVDVHAVVETKRGPYLGTPIYSGAAVPNTGIPGEVRGHTIDRLLRAPEEGIFKAVKQIGDPVEEGETVAVVGSVPVRAAIGGVVRGLLKSGLSVHRGMKVGDIHPSSDSRECFSVTDKAWAVGRGVLKAVEALLGQAIYKILLETIESGNKAVLYTVVDSGTGGFLKKGTRLLVCQDVKYGTLGLEKIDHEMVDRAHGILRGTTPCTGIIKVEGTGAKILEDSYFPEKKLLVFGGGHVAVPLVEMAAMLGYRVAVVDDRPEFANSGRFPTADKVYCLDFGEVLREGWVDREIDNSTSVVIITRGHSYDRDCLLSVIDSRASYIGMIGSSGKVRQVFRSLVAEGVSREKLARVLAPVGLDLGGHQPAEIALSIMAEIVAGENNASCRPMRELKGGMLE